MILTADQNPEYFAFASDALDASFVHSDGCRIITNLHSDWSIAAVCVYTRFHQTNLEMSIATDGSRAWADRRFLRAAFGYPFIQLGKRRVMGVVEEDNEKALNLDRKLGFVEEGRLRKWFGDKDGILFGMLKEECRWLKGIQNA